MQQTKCDCHIDLVASVTLVLLSRLSQQAVAPQVRLALLKYRAGGLWPVAGKGTREHLARVAGEAAALEPPRPADQRPAATPAAAQPERLS